MTFVIDGFKKAGAQQLINSLIPSFLKMDVNINLVLIQSFDEKEELKISNLEKINLYRVNARNLIDIKAFVRLVKILSKNLSSPIICNLYWSQIWVALSNIYLRKLQIIWVEHNIYLSRSKLQWTLMRILKKQVYMFTAVAEETSIYLRNKLNIEVKTINNCISINYFEFEPQIKKKNVVFVGRLNEQKNPMLLLRAFKNAIDSDMISSDVTLTFIGDGPLKEELENEIILNSLESRVKLLGFLPEEELIPILALSICYVSTSDHEGFGLSRIEATSQGCSIVTTNTAGIVNILVDSRNKPLAPGIFLVDNNVDSLTKGIQKGLNSDFASFKNQNLRHKLIENLSPNNCAVNYLSVCSPVKEIARKF